MSDLNLIHLIEITRIEERDLVMLNLNQIETKRVLERCVLNHISDRDSRPLCIHQISNVALLIHHDTFSYNGWCINQTLLRY